MGKRFLFLVILWWTHIERMQIKSLLGEETAVMGKNTVKRPQSAHKHTYTQKTSLTFFTIYLNVFVVWFNKMFYYTIWGFLISVACKTQKATEQWEKKPTLFQPTNIPFISHRWATRLTHQICVNDFTVIASHGWSACVHVQIYSVFYIWLNIYNIVLYMNNNNNKVVFKTH